MRKREKAILNKYLDGFGWFQSTFTLTVFDIHEKKKEREKVIRLTKKMFFFFRPPTCKVTDLDLVTRKEILLNYKTKIVFLLNFAFYHCAAFELAFFLHHFPIVQIHKKKTTTKIAEVEIFSKEKHYRMLENIKKFGAFVSPFNIFNMLTSYIVLRRYPPQKNDYYI